MHTEPERKESSSLAVPRCCSSGRQNLQIQADFVEVESGRESLPNTTAVACVDGKIYFFVEGSASDECMASIRKWSSPIS